MPPHCSSFFWRYTMLKIRRSWKDKEYKSLEEMISELSTYRGEHVAITYSKRNGLLNTVFVSVSDKGEIFNSFGDESLVDFIQIEKEILS